MGAAAWGTGLKRGRRGLTMSRRLKIFFIVNLRFELLFYINIRERKDNKDYDNDDNNNNKDDALTSF